MDLVLFVTLNLFPLFYTSIFDLTPCPAQIKYSSIKLVARREPGFVRVQVTVRFGFFVLTGPWWICGMGGEEGQKVCIQVRWVWIQTGKVTIVICWGRIVVRGEYFPSGRTFLEKRLVFSSSVFQSGVFRKLEWKLEEKCKK